MDNSNNQQSLSTEQQEAAAFLRERFLFLLASLPTKKSAEIRMHNETKVWANIRAVDLSFANILVDNLQPPQKQPSLPRVLLRTQDVLSIKYDEKLGVV